MKKPHKHKYNIAFLTEKQKFYSRNLKGFNKILKVNPNTNIKRLIKWTEIRLKDVESAIKTLNKAK